MKARYTAVLLIFASLTTPVTRAGEGDASSHQFTPEQFGFSRLLQKAKGDPKWRDAKALTTRNCGNTHNPLSLLKTPSVLRLGSVALVRPVRLSPVHF